MPSVTTSKLRRRNAHHIKLLPAQATASATFRELHGIPTRSELFSWLFGRRTVLRSVYRAVLFFVCLTAVICYVTIKTPYKLGVPSVLLTVLGVIIGFVISYRAISGYERYAAGRQAWSDVIKTCRSTGRLVWYHVPPCLTPQTPSERLVGGYERSVEEMERVMTEKRVVLDLIEGFAVSLKHHLRGEPGIYYDDLYALLAPFHDEAETYRTVESSAAKISSSSLRSQYTNTNTATSSGSQILTPTPMSGPPQSSSEPGSSQSGSSTPNPSRKPTQIVDPRLEYAAPITGPADLGPKEHPVLKFQTRNLPLDILRCLSEYFSVLDDRETVPGSSFGQMMACLTTFEGSLTELEKILTVPLPYLYASHISTVYIYLFFLPFQLVNMFGWYAIPGVTIAAFIYLGFLAAGEEIEQPFGYDENDLDLDLFTNGIIHQDIAILKRSSCLNAYLPIGEEVEFDDNATIERRATLRSKTIADFAWGVDKAFRTRQIDYEEDDSDDDEDIPFAVDSPTATTRV